MAAWAKFIKAMRLAPIGLYREGMRFGTAAAIEHENLIGPLKCRTVVDVGANRGQFALVARRCFPDATIISFEPLAEPAARYRRVFAGDSGAALHQYAIGPEKGTHVIHVSRRDDSSSLLPISDLQEDIFPGTAEIGTREIQIAPLTMFLAKAKIAAPALLKIDVQGFELGVLHGCEELLDAFTYIYAECSFVELYVGQPRVSEILAFLDQRGFELRGAHNMTYGSDGMAIQADFLFSRKPSPP
jgi:FkbM family methyltransferase